MINKRDTNDVGNLDCTSNLFIDPDIKTAGDKALSFPDYDDTVKEIPFTCMELWDLQTRPNITYIKF